MVDRRSLTAFWTACGGPGAMELKVGEGGLQQTVALQSPFLLIGRAPSSDLLLPHGDVSRRHAYLQMIAGRLWCVDLGSRTGIRRGEDRQSAFWLDGSAPLDIGPYRIDAPGAGESNVASDSAEAILERQVDKEPALPSVALEFVNLGRPGSAVAAPIWVHDRVVALVGQAQRCKVRLACPTVSHFHCSLVRTPQGLWVVDFATRNGISVNGERCRWALLLDGDLLQVGRFAIKVHIAEPGARDGVPPPVENLANPAALVGNLAAFTDQSSQPVSAEKSLVTSPSPNSSNAMAAPTMAVSPVAPAPIDPAHALVLGMVQQFAAMQQNMFDQFQQTTLMMLQSFGALHREQLELVRKELDELREVTLMLQQIQGEIASAKRAPNSTSASPVRFGATAPPRAAPPVAMQRPRPPDREAAGAPEPAERPLSPTLPEASPPGEDVHSWLCQRFADLDQERKSRWQRIVGMVYGGEGT